MTKKELKDIILKTLEKEGGAAGLKALAKAAKTSKNKLKKDLDDMSGVKQHQDGDYISTPIDEVQMAMSKCTKDSDCRGTARCVNGFCLENPKSKKPMSRKPMRGKPMPKAAISGGSKKECEVCSDCGSCKYYACNNGMCIDKGTHPPGDNPTGVKGFTGIKSLKEVKEIIEVMLDEKKKKKKDRCHRKADQVYGTKTSAYKSGAIVKCRKGMIWKVGGKKKK